MSRCCLRLSFIKNAEKIILIGIAPHIPDSHIWDVLAKTKGHIYYIGNKKKFEEWIESSDIKKYTFINNRFQEGFSELNKIL